MNGILVESYLLKKWPEPKYERKDDSRLLSVTVNHRGIWSITSGFSAALLSATLPFLSSLFIFPSFYLRKFYLFFHLSFPTALLSPNNC